MSPNCDRTSTNQASMQIGFSEYVITPLYASLHRLLPKAALCSAMIRSNTQLWKELRDEAEERAMAEAVAEAAAAAAEEEGVGGGDLGSLGSLGGGGGGGGGGDGGCGGGGGLRKYDAGEVAKRSAPAHRQRLSILQKSPAGSNSDGGDGGIGGIGGIGGSSPTPTMSRIGRSGSVMSGCGCGGGGGIGGGGIGGGIGGGTRGGMRARAFSRRSLEDGRPTLAGRRSSMHAGGRDSHGYGEASSQMSKELQAELEAAAARAASGRKDGLSSSSSSGSGRRSRFSMSGGGRRPSGGDSPGNGGGSSSVQQKLRKLFSSNAAGAAEAAASRATRAAAAAAAAAECPGPATPTKALQRKAKWDELRRTVDQSAGSDLTSTCGARTLLPPYAARACGCVRVWARVASPP
jgi:hypothetical protein